VILQVHESIDADSPPSRVWESADVSTLRRDGIDGRESTATAMAVLAARGYQLLLRSHFVVWSIGSATVYYVCPEAKL
jgi:DNA topoisomerase IA